MTNAALKACRDRNLDFNKLFRWQYLIGKSIEEELPMARHRVGDWDVAVGAQLPVTLLKDRAGVVLGLVLGIAVSPSGFVGGMEEDWQFQVAELDSEAADFFDIFEIWLKPLAGRYTILLNVQGQSRLYCDPVGMNGVVYDRQSRRIASSTLLCLNRPMEPNGLFDHDMVAGGKGKFSLFHTQDAQVRRCNPNCYIDLATFEEHRFWPKEETFTSRDSDLMAVYSELAANTKHVVGAVNARYTTALPLSGGQDSRLLAAMAGDEIHAFDQFFTHIHNYASRIDTAIAGEIARSLQLKHSVFDKRSVKVDAAQVEHSQMEFEVAAGVVAPQNREIAAGLDQGLTDGGVVMRGHQTDLLRAVFIDKLGKQGREDFRWQIKRLLIVPPRDFNGTVYRKYLPLYQDWYESLPDTARHKSVDFMFLEIYYSSTLGLTFPALHRSFFMSPFNSRRNIELSLSIDDSYRRAGHAVNDILLLNNPALHALPFDYEFGGKNKLDAILDTARMELLTQDRRTATYKRVSALCSARRV
ncbi:adenine nucleotide alpha hydrolase family protein [Pseudooceanicola spongiae]|uniref:Asparagine synthetase domain-containing protein n=1 Tax=Pseudooceanicola spongiae TaxID=2613965 RepID=A0A7M3V2S0_9RHOB|nr:hypothetical protein [Pseudooceanicola spongiae]QOL79383.1 hypothetical protein F3W81_00150 [Pseudooceanicola spongiae]